MGQLFRGLFQKHSVFSGSNYPLGHSSLSQLVLTLPLAPGSQLWTPGLFLGLGVLSTPGLDSHHLWTL